MLDLDLAAKARLRISSATQRSPLRLATFRRLATAYTINELGNWVGDVALAVLVFDRTGSALATAALFLALRFLPALLGPLLTSRIEVYDARRVLPTIHLAEGLIFLVLAWVATHFSLPAVLAVGALDGALAIAASALSRGATASLLLADDALRRGNAILNMGFSIGGALGPALAGILVSTLGPSAALLVDAGTFGVVALILATARGVRIERSDEASWAARLRSGLSDAWKRPAVRRLLVAQAFALIFFTLVIPIEVVYAKRSLHAGDAGYGALLGSWGAGMVLGSIVFAVAGRLRILLVIAISTLLIGAGYAGISVSHTLLLACVFSGLGGVGNGAQWIAVVTAVQQSVAATAQSSVMALIGAINQVMPGVGFLLGGVITTVASPRTAYAVAACGVLAVVLLSAMRPPRGLDSHGGVRFHKPDSVSEPVPSEELALSS
jgi:MFS family permease